LWWRSWLGGETLDDVAQQAGHLVVEPFHGRLPQKVMDPTENTAPPFAVLKYTMSLRISSGGPAGWPKLAGGVSNSSGVTPKCAGWFSDEHSTVVLGGVPSRGSARSTSNPAAPPPE
jgi:hypothetical protein